MCVGPTALYLWRHCLLMYFHAQALGVYFMLRCTAERNQISRSQWHNMLSSLWNTLLGIWLWICSASVETPGELLGFPSIGFMIFCPGCWDRDECVSTKHSPYRFVVGDSLSWCVLVFHPSPSSALICNCKCAWVVALRKVQPVLHPVIAHGVYFFMTMEKCIWF